MKLSKWMEQLYTLVSDLDNRVVSTWHFHVSWLVWKMRVVSWVLRFTTLPSKGMRKLFRQCPALICTLYQPSDDCTCTPLAFLFWLGGSFPALYASIYRMVEQYPKTSWMQKRVQLRNWWKMWYLRLRPNRTSRLARHKLWSAHTCNSLWFTSHNSYEAQNNS